MDRHWGQIRAWHVLKADGDPGMLAGRVYDTLCGRQVALGAPIRDDLGSEASCESCLRKLARQEDVSASATRSAG